MTPVALGFLALWLITTVTLILLGCAWSRSMGRMSQENADQGVQIDRLEAQAAHLSAECRKLRDREGHRRVFGTAPLDTTESGGEG